jgi:hypothetical protein
MTYEGFVLCNSGDFATGGGFVVFVYGVTNLINVDKSHIYGTDGWIVAIENQTSQEVDVAVSVVCADVTP